MKSAREKEDSTPSDVLVVGVVLAYGIVALFLRTIGSEFLASEMDTPVRNIGLFLMLSIMLSYVVIRLVFTAKYATKHESLIDEIKRTCEDREPPEVEEEDNDIHICPNHPRGYCCDRCWYGMD